MTMEYRAESPLGLVFAEHRDVERVPGRDSEWVIGYGESDDYAESLVLGTTDIAVAIARFRNEHPPTTPMWGVQRAELDQGGRSPDGYLDRYDEIPVVGGAKPRKSPGRS